MPHSHPSKHPEKRRKANAAARPHGPASSAGSSAGAPPDGYRLIDDAFHQIGLRDLVYHGGSRSGWMPARRAGDYESFRRDSVALAVAVPD